MLQVVRDHADEPDAQRDRRVPVLVHHAVEVRLAQALDVLDRMPVDGFVIPDEQVGWHPDRSHFRAGVPVAGLGWRERQPEPFGPAFRRPGLLGARHVGDVIVLDPGQVPDQPRDRVPPAVWPERQLVLGQTAHGAQHHAVDPAEHLGQQFADRHAPSSLPQAATVPPAPQPAGVVTRDPTSLTDFPACSPAPVTGAAGPEAGAAWSAPDGAGTSRPTGRRPCGAGPAGPAWCAA